MKRIEDIENMEFSELLRISDDDSVKAERGFDDQLEELVCDLELSEKILTEDEAVVEERSPRRWIGISGIAAAVALLFGVGVGLTLGRQDDALVDTYDDPALAYAQVQKALMKIGSGMQAGVESVQKGNDCIEKPAEILNAKLK